MRHVRHVEPVPAGAATGLLAEVYAQVEAESSSIGPAVAMCSPAPGLMAAGWALMREAQLAGGAPLSGKAMVAVGVSCANDVRYDVDGYLAVLRAAGAPEAADAIAAGASPPVHAGEYAWALGTAGERPRPCAEEAYVGTALFTHFINRMVLAMLPAALSPGAMRDGEQPFAGAPVLRAPAPREPGASLALLAGPVRRKPPAWSDGPIGIAYAALCEAATAGGDVLPSARACGLADELIAVHGGRRTPDVDVSEVLAGLPDEDRRAAALVVLAGLAPERITDADVAAWRAYGHGDAETVLLLAYGAMGAVEAIEERLT